MSAIRLPTVMKSPTDPCCMQAILPLQGPGDRPLSGRPSPLLAFRDALGNIEGTVVFALSLSQAVFSATSSPADKDEETYFQHDQCQTDRQKALLMLLQS